MSKTSYISSFQEFFPKALQGHYQEKKSIKLLSKIFFYKIYSRTTSKPSNLHLNLVLRSSFAEREKHLINKMMRKLWHFYDLKYKNVKFSCLGVRFFFRLANDGRKTGRGVPQNDSARHSSRAIQRLRTKQNSRNVVYGFQWDFFASARKVLKRFATIYLTHFPGRNTSISFTHNYVCYV